MKIRGLKLKVQGSGLSEARKFESSEVRNPSVLLRYCSTALISWLLLFCAADLLLYIGLQPLAFASDKWAGVDESVVEKFAKEHGREAREPLINTDQGDLLLFVFLLAGAVGGFIGGYYWRILVVEKAPKIRRDEQKITGWKN